MSFWEGSAWQDAMDRQREQTAKRGRSGCGHPGCTEEDRHPVAAPECSLRKPLSISIPANGHVHIDCPAHGSHVLRGSGATL